MNRRGAAPPRPVVEGGLPGSRLFAPTRFGEHRVQPTIDAVSPPLGWPGLLFPVTEVHDVAVTVHAFVDESVGAAVEAEDFGVGAQCSGQFPADAGLPYLGSASEAGTSGSTATDGGTAGERAGEPEGAAPVGGDPGPSPIGREAGMG